MPGEGIKRLVIVVVCVEWNEVKLLGGNGHGSLLSAQGAST